VTVERLVKERLVGAAVLMAAAIILIPEMLSGPDQGKEADLGANSGQAAAKSGEGGGSTRANGNSPIKTYTIDLSQSPGARAAQGIDENRAPPAEEIPTPLPAAAQESPAADPQVKPESTEESTRAAAVATQPQASDESPPAVVEPPTRTPPPATTSSPSRTLASDAATPTSGGWAVQLGSFSKQSTAERLAGEMRTQGHDAFVMPVKSGAATLYRVRIGPMTDRASAETALRSVKPKAPGAAVVANP
jgi:DedD protein